MSTTLREAFISTLHSDLPIEIESMTDEYFFFYADFEIPVQTMLFLKDPKAIEEGIKKLKRFEVVEFEKSGKNYRYYAFFYTPKFSFEEWKKKHQKK